MRLRAPRAASLILLLTPSLVVLCQSTPSTEVAAASPHNAASSAAPASPHDTATGAITHSPTAKESTPSHVLFFYTAPRSTVEMEVHTVPPTNEARLDRLRAAFSSAQCGGDNMREQPVTDKHGTPGVNLICTWPGEDPASGTIVVAAHYEHEGKGEGALADWSGAALLPLLYKAIQGQPRENTFVFVESFKSDGAQTWLKSLNREDRRRIRAMIDLDALGLGVTRYFTTFSFMETTPLSALHLQTELLWAAIDDGVSQTPEQTSPRHWLSIDPTDPFRALLVPTIVIHSVPPESDHIPGSAADIASAVDGNAYFQTYHLMCTYLASLDRIAKKLALNDPFWKAVPGTDNEPAIIKPIVTFRQLGGVMKH